jgi:hypothetical protein
VLHVGVGPEVGKGGILICGLVKNERAEALKAEVGISIVDKAVRTLGGCHRYESLRILEAVIDMKIYARL